MPELSSTTNPPIAPVKPEPPPTAARPRPRRRGWRFWLVFGLLLALLGAVAALLFYPPAWHATLRALLASQAEQRGLKLEIGGIRGSLLEATVLSDVHLATLQTAVSLPSQTRTDLRIRRVELVFAGRVPFFQRPLASWLRRCVLEDVRGALSLDWLSAPAPASASAGGKEPWRAVARRKLARLAVPLFARLAPANFQILNPSDADLTLHRDQFHLRLSGFQLTCQTNAPGQLQIGEVEVRGPGGFVNHYAHWHAGTRWRDGKLTLTNLALTPELEVTSATLDASRLWADSQRRLDGDLTVRALGGEIRCQVTARLARPQLELEAAGLLQRIAISPLVELLGVEGPTGGEVRAGQFSFRGDPQNLPASAGSLRAEANDFQWGSRRWQQLIVAVTIINRRVTVHELELVQSRNRLSFNGECFLPPPAKTGEKGAEVPWWRDHVSCNIDARLNDLHAFGLLLGPAFPQLAGRMSVQGALNGGDGGRIDGQLSVEGGALSIRRAPLDRLRATLLFRGEELQVVDLQASRGTDTFSGKGTFQLTGPRRYAAEIQAAVKDLAPYHTAYEGIFSPQPMRGALALDWSGDGTAQAHSGVFRLRLERFQAPAGPGALPRPVDVNAEGSYSPASVSFRHLLVRDRAKADAFDVQFTGALPFIQDVSALAAGRWFHEEGTLTGKLEFADAALDLLPPLLPWLLGEADGRLSGGFELGGTPRAPRITGKGQLHQARFRWKPPGLAVLNADAVEAEARLEGGGDSLQLDKCQGEVPAGGAFTLGGRVQWRESAAPLQLELTLQAKNLELPEQENLRARADLNWTIRGTSAQPAIAGEVHLRDGRFFHALEIVPASEKSDAPLAGCLLPLPWLAAGPAADCALDLQITAEPALRIEVPRANLGGELAPALRLTGTGRRLALGGKLTFQHNARALAPGNRVLDVENGGAFYFSPGQPINEPLVAVTVSGKAAPVGLWGSAAEETEPPAGVWTASFYGPLTQGLVAFSAAPPRPASMEGAAGPQGLFSSLESVVFGNGTGHEAPAAISLDADGDASRFSLPAWRLRLR